MSSFERARGILAQHNFLRSRDRALNRNATNFFVVHVRLNLGISKGTGNPIIIK
jgi:hypothetical protein